MWVLLMWILLLERLGPYLGDAFGWVNWLNQNSGAVQAVATVVLICVTVYYAWQTKRTSDETKRLVQAATEQADASVQMARGMRASGTHVVALLSFAERLVYTLAAAVGGWQQRGGELPLVPESDPYYPDFKQHLAGHPFWDEWNELNKVFNGYDRARLEAWEAIQRVVEERAPRMEDRLKDIMSSHLFNDAVRRARDLVGLDKPNDLVEGQPPEVLQVYCELRRPLPENVLVRQVAEREQGLAKIVEKLQQELLPDRVLKLVLDGHCDHCA